MIQLVVEHGPHSGQVLNVPAGKSVIGRSSDATFPLLNDPTVSRTHVELNTTGGDVFIRDLGSTSATYVNGVLLNPNSFWQVRPGDRLRLGQTVVLVREAQGIAPAPPAPPSVPNPNACSKCNSAFALLGARARSGQFAGMCNGCAKDLLGRIDRFRQTMQNEFTFWNGYPNDLSKRIDVHCQSLVLDRALALGRIRDLTTSFLQRVLTFLLQGGQLSEDHETLFHQFRRVLDLPEQQIPNLVAQLRHYSFVRDLQSGKLPTVTPSIMIPAGEIAHIEVPATFYRELASGMRFHEGRLVVTSGRLVFTNTDVPFEAALSKVVGTTYCPPNQFELHLTRKQGTGRYSSPDAFYLVEVLRAVLSFHLRQVTVQQAGSRVIPQDVKAAVWARDGGRCVQCGESLYLEFDHVIPFSKGGASSLNNVQLLCRKCNLAKSDGI